MTEYELIEAYQGAEASWQASASIFISIVFAYLAAAYFVGAKLTRSQVVIVTGLYTVFCLLMLSMLGSILSRLTQFGTEILEFSPERSVAGGPTRIGGLALWGSVFVSAYVAGLVFMFQIRRSARRQSQTP
jgi:hypothetical protein